MNIARKLLVTLLVVLMVMVSAQAAVAKWAEGPGDDDGNELQEEVPAPFRDLKELVADLKAANQDPRDDDRDGLPNTVEAVIGTDPRNPDSDFDGVPDDEEVSREMDPNEPDSNRDGLGDWFEVRGGHTDLDGDGLHNAWDWDNDGDGVNDGLDMSPDSRSPMGASLHFDVTTTGEPMYLYFQLRPKNPNNMRLVEQIWDWPSDKEGTMRDLDDSIDDVTISPLLLLQSDTIPPEKDLTEYGLQANDDTVFMPIFPVWDYGNVVAFKAQMYFPACATRTNLAFNLSLKWKVTGNSDNVIKALKYATNGFHLSAVDTGPVMVNGTEVRDPQLLRWMDLGNDRVGMLADNGMYLSVGTDGVVRANALEMEDEEIFTLVKSGTNYAIRAYNDLYLTVKGDGRVVADSNTANGGAKFTLLNLAPRPSQTTLAYYADQFMLTGCYFEECRGTEVGVFWNDNQTDALATHLVMAYNYTHNATTKITDMPQMLTDEEVSFNHTYRTFSHRDLALQAIASEMIPAARDRLPTGDALPIITIMEDSYAAVQMTNMTGGGHITSTTIGADLSVTPVLVTKSLKSNWFKLGGEEEVPIEDIIIGMRSWEMEQEDLINLIGLTMAWNAGEKTIAKIGSILQDFDYAEVDSVGPTVKSVIKGGITGLKTLRTVLLVIDSIYACCKFVKLAPFAKPTGITSAVKMFKASYSTATAAKSGWLGQLNKAGKALAVIGLVVEIGFALYALFAIGEATGWSTVGTATAVIYAVMMIAYAIVLFAIGQIPVVGWILAALIALSDAIVGWIFGKGWSSMLMEAIIDAITDFKVRSEPDMQMSDTEVDIQDKDGNNLDVGDRIEYKSYVIGWVNRTSDGNVQDLKDSYIKPYIDVTVPTESNSKTGKYTTKDKEEFDTSHWKFKRTEYTAVGWAEPGTPMVNYPMTICLKADYRAYYDECWWIIFYGWDCSREYQEDTVESDPSTVYFDVMPGSIDAFAKWRGITSCDHDGDGLNNSEETSTDPWKWDSDADGLGDAFEYSVGTDPAKYDTDKDGLNDKQEIQLGTNPTKRDSDADGLDDYFEYAGWVVYFDFFGTEFEWYINSNPGINNTEGDLLNDWEEYVCLLNPRSSDTDGDGLPDDMRDYYKTTFEFRYLMAEAGRPYACTVDNAGNLYTSTYDEGGSSLSYLVKWKPDGSPGTIFAPSTTTYSHIVDLTTGPDGYIYAVDSYDGIYKFSTAGAISGPYGKTGTYQLVHPYDVTVDENGNMYVTDGWTNDPNQRVMVFDKTGAYVRQFGTKGAGNGQFLNPRGICLDSEKNIYVVDQSNGRVQMFYNNGTFITKWGSVGGGTGQFRIPTAVEVDGNGDVFVVDYSNARVQKFNATGRWINTLGELGNTDGQFNQPIDIAFDTHGEFYVSDRENYRVQKFGQRVEFIKAEPRYPFTDTDGDGIPDVLERTERTIVIVSTHGIAGIQMLNVTSDPNVADTDGDGVPDGDEYNNQTDPRSPDTDMDGVTDLAELILGTNLTHYDTDLDGLEDGIELTFNSDPLLEDTDGDTLKDLKEFALGINPRNNDTDEDGLDDAAELLAGSDPRGPDTDADGVFDSFELTLGTRPTLADNDGDGLIDGYEQFFETDPTSPDSDDDGLGDNFEVETRLNPLSNDTDEDGVDDATELELGLNPRSKDSDGDRIPDSLDTDYEIVLPEGVVLAADADDRSVAFAAKLSTMVKVTEVSADELLASHKNARYIVVVGRPDGNEGTAGALIRTLLADSGDLVDRMATSYELRIVMRFGVWTSSQTIILVSYPQPNDAIRVLGMLKSMRATVAGSTIEYQYLNERSCFWFDEVDLVKLTDVSLSGKLEEMAEFNVKVSKFSGEDTPQKLELDKGLDALYIPTGRYVEVDFSENIVSPERNILNGMALTMYYTVFDLDMTGDGDADDDADLNETTLAVYWYNTTNGMWERLDEEMDWVLWLELNTTDVERYGTQYAGSFCVTVAHASLFGHAALPKGLVPTVARAGLDRTVFVNEEVIFDGSTSEGNGALNYTWTFRYRLSRVTLFGAAPDFVFEEPGEYSVTLTVLDSLGATDHDAMVLTVAPITDRKFTLGIGPVTNELGDPVEGVRARLTVSMTTFVKSTDEDGIADLELSESFLGMPVTLKLTKSGYEVLEYETTITAGKVLETPPPTFMMVRVPTVARAGLDIQTNVGSTTQFDGSESEGNGNVLTYEWTVTQPSGVVTLSGPTPTHVFTTEGVYEVRLKVTDILGVSAEDTVSVTVGPRLEVSFMLSVGPIVDSKGRVLEGAEVRIVYGRDVFSNTTSTAGIALVEVPTEAIGKDIWVTVVAKGFETVEYQTTIGAGKTLAQPPSSMVAKKDVASEGGIGGAAIIGLVLVLVLVLIVVFLIVMRRRGRPSEEGPVEGPEADVEVAAEGAEAEKALEDVEALLEEPAAGEVVSEEEDDAVVVRAPEPPSGAEPTAMDEEESHVVSRPITHQRTRGRTPPKVAPPAKKGSGGLAEKEADAELESEEPE